jgi:FAD/FMN-containing dehydrogenases
MPEPDQLTLDNSESIIVDLRKISKNVLSEEEEKAAYETDGLSVHRQRPIAVVLPETAKEVSEILKYCYRNNVKVVPRGAGTGLSGGALPLKDSVLVSLGKFNKILDIDFDNRCVVTQPGVTNLAITGAVQHEGFYYAPDPSSQLACSIGGNISTNAGGVHSLKYGVTTNNVLGIEMVLIDGTIIRLGGKNLDAEGYDLLGIMTGSEGLLAVITEITVRILKKPQSVRAVLIGFDTNNDAGNCVAEIISSGIIPAGMEIMDKPLIIATDNFAKAGYPRDVEILLIVELDGTESEVDTLINRVLEIAKKIKLHTIERAKVMKKDFVFGRGEKRHSLR